jgi:hypothetical protein
VSPKHRVGVFWDAGSFKINRENYPGMGNATNAPETGGIQPGNGSSRLQQAKWTATMTSRLLLEAGLGTYQQNWNSRERPGNDRELIRVVEQCTTGCPNNGGIQGLTYRAMNWNADWMSPNRAYAHATYVTGGHSIKGGYQGVLHINMSNPFTNNHNLQYRFNNGIPNQLTQNLLQYRTEERTRYDALSVVSGAMRTSARKCRCSRTTNRSSRGGTTARPTGRSRPRSSRKCSLGFLWRWGIRVGGSRTLR